MWFCKRKIGILTIDAKFSNELIQYLVQHKILSNSLLMKAKIDVNHLSSLTHEPSYHQQPQRTRMTPHNRFGVLLDRMRSVVGLR
jgi:hypothetical protein